MLTAQTMKRFRIAKDWSNAGFFETTRLTQLQDDVRAAILAGKLVAISGPVGSGKTMMINRLQDRLTGEKTMIVARSLSVDKPRVALPSLITALFLDVSGDATMKAPTQPEKRERLLQELIRNPEGPRILVTGDVKLIDADIVFRTLDRIRDRHPDLVLVHKGSAGAESIAGMWARLRGVDAMIVRTDWSLGKRAPFRANDAMLALTPKAIGAVIFGGGGVAANLAQKAHAQRIPVMTAIEPAVALQVAAVAQDAARKPTRKAVA